MRIGIDLDNTIINYERAFLRQARDLNLIPIDWHGSKIELRNFLNAGDPSEYNWQKIQGIVYGKNIDFAELYSGLEKFLIVCKKFNSTVFIVSHKTEFGHHDKSRVSLRESAVKFLESRNFFNSEGVNFDKNNIFFESTREEKISKIASLNLDIFIDDLIEVLQDQKFPHIRKIHFSPSEMESQKIEQFASWDLITQEIFNQQDRDLSLLRSFSPIEIDKVISINGRGNSRVMLGSGPSGPCFIKSYPEDSSDSVGRLCREILAYKLLEGSELTPKLIAHNLQLGYGIYEWIDGASISDVTEYELGFAIKLIEKLIAIPSDGEYPLAKDACLSPKDYCDQIEFRLNALLSVRNKELSIFLENRFIPLFKKIMESCSNSHIYSEKISLSDQILSPSDFGFHNACKLDEKIVFFDFEYFGRDDLTRMTADFLWHPAMNMNFNVKKLWVDKIAQLSNDPFSFRRRLDLVWPLCGLRWVMIILNEFKDKIWRQRLAASNDDSLNRDERLKMQLRKASLFSGLVEEGVHCPYL